MVGASQVARRVRELTKGREQIEFGFLVKTIYGQFPSELRPIQRAIVETELTETGWFRRPRDTVWEKG
jgi:hypothetical protein